MQLDLFAMLEAPAELLKYKAFKEANPWVLPRLTRMSHDLRKRGHRQYGIKALIEVLRWEHSLTHDPSCEFKFNNNYCPFMAREIMKHEPMLEGFFKIRESVADRSEDY